MAHRPVHRRLARRPAPTTAGASSTRFERIRSTTPISASSRTSTSSPPARVRETNTPTVGTSTDPVVRRRLLRSSRWWRSRPILWNLAGPLTFFGVTVPKALFWIVLAVRGRRHGGGVLDRPADDPAELPQRDDQRRVPLRAGAGARRRRGGGLLPWRARRARSAVATASRAIIANYRALVWRGVAFLGWNRTMTQIVDPLPLVIQAPRLFAGEITFGDVRQSSGAFVDVQGSLSFFRAVYDAFAELPGRDHPPGRAGHRQRTGKGATAIGERAPARRWRGAGRRRGDARRPGDRIVDEPRLRLDAGRLAGDHRAVGHAARRRCCAAWRRCGRTPRARVRCPMRSTASSDVPVPAALCARWATCAPWCAIRTSPDAFDDDAIREALDTVALGHLAAPARRERRLVEGAVPR